MDKRIVKTLNNIRDSFFELAYERGIDGVNVTSLCEKALINKATFYAHYEGMYQLIEQMEEETVREIARENVIRVDTSEDIPDFLIKMIYSFSENKKDKVFLTSSRREHILDKLFQAVREDFYHSFPTLRRVDGFDVALRFIYDGLCGAIMKPEREGNDINETVSALSKCLSGILGQFGEE